MTILFIPNDPEAKKSPPARKVAPAAARRAGKTAFDFGTLPQLKVWPADSPEFLVWQCREAVMRALAMWEKIAGPLKHWQGSTQRKKLKVNIDEGSDLNAYYDRQSLGYYHFRSKKTKLLRRFAASTDVVSHECGHALLDAVRPELWDSNFPEPNAFHEAFGDCVAPVDGACRPRNAQGLAQPGAEARQRQFCRDADRIAGERAARFRRHA